MAYLDVESRTIYFKWISQNLWIPTTETFDPTQNALIIRILDTDTWNDHEVLTGGRPSEVLSVNTCFHERRIFQSRLPFFVTVRFKRGKAPVKDLKIHKWWPQGQWHTLEVVKLIAFLFSSLFSSKRKTYRSDFYSPPGRQISRILSPEKDSTGLRRVGE